MTVIAGLAAAVVVLSNVWWLLAGLIILMGVPALRDIAAAVRQQRVLDRQRQRATAARADRQNAQVLAGDDRGVYGDYPPETTEGPRLAL